MSSSRIERTLTRIAFQIYEDTRGSENLYIMGINDRGLQLADILAAKLSEIYHSGIKANPVNLKNESSSEEEHSMKKAHPVAYSGIEDKKVVIVDDVIYSGKTMFQTLQMLTSAETPEEIKLAALVDRGHRRFPLNIEYLGMFCPTKLDEHVHCSFTDKGVPEGVWLYANSSSRMDRTGFLY